MTLQDLLPAVLGAGGTAFVAALFQGVKSLMEGARAKERDAIVHLEEWRDDADERARDALLEADYQRRVVAYWMTRAGALAYELTKHGIPVPDAMPPPALPTKGTTTP